MRVRNVFLGLVVFSALFLNTAFASLIVDTGALPPANSGAYNLDSSQWLAGEFSLTQATTITAIDGFLYTTAPGDLTIALYKDSNDLPDKNNELFTGVFHANGALARDWYGIDGLNYSLSPDNYWVAFEVRGGSQNQFSGPMPYPFGSPLANYAFTSPSYNYDYHSYLLDVGVRIYGDTNGGPVAPVPEPATLSLLGLGLLGLVFKKKTIA